MKIVILISVFERGGAERQALLLAKELRDRYSLNVEVWALMWSGTYEAEFNAAGIPTKVLEFRYPETSLHFVWRLRRVLKQLRRARIDILLPFTTWPNVVAGLTYRLAGIKYCIWGERHSGGERVPGFEFIAARQYKHFVANSTAGATFLHNEMRIPESNITIVPNGVEISYPFLSNINWRNALGITNDQCLVVKIANITSKKDHATLLRSWRLLLDRWNSGPPPLLALAGYFGDNVDGLRQLSKELDIDSTVRFLGPLSPPTDLILACDLAVFSSRSEGMPNGVLECMAAGKAIVATDLPGTRDALGPEMNEFLVPAGEPDLFARKLHQLLRNNTLRRDLGLKNLERAQSEFSVPRMAERHLEIIRSITSHRHCNLKPR